ncbi:MAG TPA: class III signal peptide-containing protein [Candidatus Omnitrophota bacterium]|nr:class III signal peptide-containing protein [Candidatus Omnitrophota bacterium]HRZ03482.1 class III signal peptide-containing protein [Candidatus Omnitrophota bacterium]
MLRKLRSRKRGQSTMEYLILVAGVIAILIVFLKPSGVFRTALNSTYQDASQGMENMANRLKGSH